MSKYSKRAAVIASFLVAESRPMKFVLLWVEVCNFVKHGTVCTTCLVCVCVC